MRLIKLPTLRGDVYVNPERVISVSDHRGAGVEVRFEPGGFGGAVVYTTLPMSETVRTLMAP